MAILSASDKEKLMVEVHAALKLVPSISKMVDRFITPRLDSWEVNINSAGDLVRISKGDFRATMACNGDASLWLSCELGVFENKNSRAMLGTVGTTMFIKGDMDLANIVNSLRRRLKTDEQFVHTTLNRSML